MTFLNPMLAIYAAAASVPLLVLLYFLKLRRQSVVVSSTLLWRRAVQDLQVNSPFQRIRNNILLYLQLLLLAAVLLALGRPVVSMTSGPPKRFVLLIDRSASMNAADAAPTRLGEAKRQARQLVESMRARVGLTLQDQSDQAMIVAFDEHAKVMCNFTNDKKQLLSAIDAITPTDGQSMLGEAVSVARAFAQSPGVDANNRSSETPAQLELFSDGKLDDLTKLILTDGELNFHRIGKDRDNVALTAMAARRNYDKPEDIEVFANLANYSDSPITVQVQLSLDAAVKAVRPIDIPACRPPTDKDPGGPGQSSVTFTLTHDKAALVEVRQLSKDALAADDAAWCAVGPPKRLTALLVTSGNAVLQSVLKACPLAKLDVCSGGEFDKLDFSAAAGAASQYDVIILDRHVPASLPRGRFLVLGRPPKASGVKADEEIKNQTVIDWRSRHPVLQSVNMSELFAAKAYKMVLPPQASVLAEFTGGPALALVRTGGSMFLLAPFDCLETNWPFQPGFVMFCFNALNYLGLEIAQEQEASLKVGQAITLESLPAGAEAQIAGPSLPEMKVAVDPSGYLRFPNTARAGVYRVDVPGRPPAIFAVNLLSAVESDIAPAEKLSVMGQTVESSGPVMRGNVEIWPWLILFAVAMACLEWIVYNRKVRV